VKPVLARLEAFESAEAFLESVDRDGIGCVLLDVRRPGMGGVELLRHLAATGPCIPVITLAAHADDETRRRSLEAGAAAFLEKPFRTSVIGLNPTNVGWTLSIPRIRIAVGPISTFPRARQSRMDKPDGHAAGGRRGRPRDLTIRSHPDDSENVFVAVQDTGVGIDPSHLDRLYNAFFTNLLPLARARPRRGC
jgi:CheY-like chemotaxis protein